MEFHEAAKTFPLMNDNRLSELVEDIRQRGQLEPITLCEGKVLDGRNRYLACEQLSIEPKVKVYDGDPWSYVWSLNGQRRDLVAEQRYLVWKFCSEQSAKWQAEQQRIMDEANRKRSQAAKEQHEVSRPYAGEYKKVEKMVLQQSVVVPSNHRKGQQSKAVASKTNPGAVARGDKLAKERPDLAEKVRVGEISPAKAQKQFKKDAAEKERQAAAQRLSEAMPVEGLIELGDFRDLGRSVADNNCSLVFTDPPYDRESLPLFADLGEFAHRVLMKGGSLITFCGQYVMEDVMHLLGNHLRYFWVCCCLHTGDTAEMREYGIKVKWKPLLWYVKGQFRYDREVWLEDLVQSQQEKDFHPWQQSVIEAKHFIEKLTRPGDLVCDPFCGGGTTAVAAKALSRKYWTCDVDARHVEKARERLS